MAVEIILQTVLPVFLIVLVGYVIGRFRKVEIKPFVDLLVYIAAPCLIISSVSRSTINLTDFWSIASSALLIIGIMGAVFFVVLKIRRSDRSGLSLPMVIGNTGYLGYPIALFAFGTEGLSRAVVYDMMNALVLFSIGIYIVHQKNQIREAFKIPLIYAVIIGIGLNLLSIQIPEVIFIPMEMIGYASIPLALMVIGYKLTEIKLVSMKLTIFGTLFRILGGAGTAVLVTMLLSATGLARNIIILQAAMPSATMSLILTQKYHKDADVTASILLMSIIASVVSIPIILALL